MIPGTTDEETQSWVDTLKSAYSSNLDEFDQMYQLAPEESRRLFEEWKVVEHPTLALMDRLNRSKQQQHNPLMPAGMQGMHANNPAHKITGVTGDGAPPPGGMRAGQFVRVADCPACLKPLSFNPPTSQQPKNIQCPSCKSISSWAVCWTCPRVILFDSQCRHCMMVDLGSSGSRDITPRHVSHSSPSGSLSAPAIYRQHVPAGEKGLTNRAGQNACFLNVTLQSFWHLKGSFRDQFEAWQLDHPSDCSCLYCSLRLILTNYKFSDEDAVRPDALQNSLALLYAEESRFQVGDMSDATECFDAICQGLHQVYKESKDFALTWTDDQCTCVSHTGFTIRYETSSICDQCGWIAEPEEQQMFIHYAYASELSAAAKDEKKFDKNLAMHNHENRRECGADGCSNRVQVNKLLLNPFPRCFAIGLVWASQDPSQREIESLLSAIRLDIDLYKLFDNDLFRKKFRRSKKKKYRLVGLVTYYLRHYAAYFRNSASGIWYSFDDVSVSEVGPHWQQVCRRCIKGRAKPTLLFFEERKSSKKKLSPRG